MKYDNDIKPILLIVIAVCLFWIVGIVFLGKLVSLQEEKTALEIKILQHELAAYEAMDKELKGE